MDDMIASLISQANDLRKMKVHPGITDEVHSLIVEAESLVDDALHLATDYDPEA